MEAEKLIEHLQKLLARGVEVGLITGIFVLKFPDSTTKTLELCELAEILEKN